jgi:8-oxo-dGTP pyrophosphatase MutT (NUDIX family)
MMRVNVESIFVKFLLFILQVRRIIKSQNPSMQINISKETISQRLEQALVLNGVSSTGYSEIDTGADIQLRSAAVLVPLVWQEDEWHLLYTRRTATLQSHKGQVSFPGGACDDGETTPEQTALREADEEIGLKPGDVILLGRLADMITVSYFQVTPVVGVIKWPTVFQVGEAEVARVFIIPLGWLANSSNRWQFEISGTNRSVIAYHPFDGELLWGATARMTVDFLTVLGY